MDELTAHVAAAAALSPEVAAQAIAIILAFLKTEAPPEQVAELFAALPGAEAAAAAGAGAGGGALGGLMGMFGGGGLMGVAAKLTALGLGMSEMQAVGGALLGAVRDKVGADRMEAITAGIPGLAQLL